MSTDLVPAENMAAVEALDPQAREAAVTHMLSEARAWLAHAVESTTPQAIANFKAQMATVAEATKQLNLSKGIQLDALEMVRRAERSVGLAIRKGQAEGGIGSVANPGSGPRRDYVRGGSVVHVHPVPDRNAISPSDVLQHSQERVDVYAMTDGVTDEDFEAAVSEAKDEGNLSRANVVRKVKDLASPETRDMRAVRVAEMAQQGHDSKTIACAVGIGRQTVSAIARDYGFTIPADAVTSRRKGIGSSEELLDRAVDSADALAMSLTYVNPSELGEGADKKIDALMQSITAIRKAAHRIKESIS